MNTTAIKALLKSSSVEEEKALIEFVKQVVSEKESALRSEISRTHTPDEIEEEIVRLSRISAPTPPKELVDYWKTREYPPIPLVDTRWMTDENGVPNDIWLRVRKHGPFPVYDPRYLDFTVTGSFVSVVRGCNPWMTKTEGWKEKKGIWQAPKKSNTKQLKNGHLLESNAAFWFSELTGYKVVDDTIMYQSSVKNWAIADTDRLYYNSKLKKWGVLECKSTTYQTAKDHWEPGVFLLGASDHANGRFPAYYESQLRFYMWLMDMDIGCFVCVWGSNPETDLTIVEIERNREYEKEMLEELEAFIASLSNDIPPSILENEPGVAAEGIKRLYPTSNPEAAAVGLPQDFLPLCDVIIRCSEEIKELEEKKKLASLQIQEIMQDSESGSVQIDDDYFYSISWKSRNAKPSVDTKRMREEDPEMYDKYVTSTSSRPFLVSKKKIKKKISST